MIDLGVVGLDLSLTRPAAVRIPNGWRPGDWAALEVASWPSKPAKTETATAKERARWDRVAAIVDHVRTFLLRTPGLPIFVEDYAYGIQGDAITKLAELRGALCHALHHDGIYLRPVNISTARKLLLGKLPSRRKGEPPLPRGAAKLAVQQALYAAGATRLDNDDECDAFAVANLGLSETGWTAVCLGQTG